jgi:hypothetical protein
LTEDKKQHYQELIEFIGESQDRIARDLMGLKYGSIMASDWTHVAQEY